MDWPSPWHVGQLVVVCICPKRVFAILVTCPLPWQVLQLVNNQTLLNIELKGADTAEPLVTLLKKAETELGTDPDKLLISSFNHHLLQQIKKHRPNLKLGALTASLPLDYAAFASELGAWSVNCDKGFINQECCRRICHFRYPHKHLCRYLYCKHRW